MIETTIMDITLKQVTCVIYTCDKCGKKADPILYAFSKKYPDDWVYVEQSQATNHFCETCKRIIGIG